FLRRIELRSQNVVARLRKLAPHERCTGRGRETLELAHALVRQQPLRLVVEPPHFVREIRPIEQERTGREKRSVVAVKDMGPGAWGLGRSRSNARSAF